MIEPLKEWGLMVGGYVLAAILLAMWVGAKEDLAQEIERCNTSTALAVADAEKITRKAVQDAADERIRQLEADRDRNAAEAAKERQKRLQAESVADKRERELQELAEEAFDEDELPDSHACLNAFISSAALRCVLDQGKAGVGAGAGESDDLRACANSRFADGVHPGFSNVTYGQGLLFWGGDRGAALRWNERAAEIRRIEGEVIDGNGE